MLHGRDNENNWELFMYFDIQFVVVVCLYVWLSANVNQWKVNAILVSVMFTPELFIKFPQVYSFFQILFVMIAASSLSYTVWIPWYIGIGVLVVAWFYARWLGQIRAFNLRRKFMHDAIASAESEEDRASYERQSKLSNAELWDYLGKLKAIRR